MIGLRDDDGNISKSIYFLMGIGEFNTNRDIIIKALLDSAEKNKKKLSKLAIEHFDSLYSELHNSLNKKKSLAIWKVRNSCIIIIEMIFRGIEYKAIDEKKKELLKQLVFNQYNPKMMSILRKMTHDDYDFLKRKIESATINYELNWQQIKNLGYDGLVKLNDLKKNKVIDITPSKKTKKASNES